VTSIGDNAFTACSGLNNIAVDSSNNNYASDSRGVLFNKAKTTLIRAPGAIRGAYSIPDSVTSIEESAFSSCSSLASVTIPNSVTSIGGSAFSGCSSLTSVTIPDSVTSIGYRAFYECSGLTSVTISDSVTRIESFTFDSCSGLMSMTIPGSVTSIGHAAFSACTKLTSTTIPDSVTSIGDYAFYYCSGLKDVYYTGTSEQWKAISIGDNNSNLTGATIHYNVVAGVAKLIGNVPNSQYCILVRDSAGKPIAGAAVTYDTQKGTTDKNGLAVFDRLTVGEPTITASCSGYRNYSNADTDYQKSENGYDVIVLYTTGESPYKLACARYVDPWRNVDVLTGTQRLSLSNASDIFDLQCGTVDKSGAASYSLMQGSKTIASSADGSFSGLTVGQFIKDKPVFVRVTASGTAAVDTKLNLLIVEDKAQESTSFSCGNETAITVDSDIPVVGGSKLTFDIPPLPVEVYVSDDTVRVGINANLAGDDHKTQEEKIDDLKKSIEQLKKLSKLKDTHVGNSLQANLNFLMKEKTAGKFGPIKSNLTFIGYGEGKLDSSGNVTVKAYLCLLASASTKFQGPTVLVLGIPLTYSVKISLEGKLVGEVSWDLQKNTFFGDITFTFTPALEFFGGVGLSKFVGGGAYGSAELPIEIQLIGTTVSPGLNKVDLTGEIGIKVYAGLLEYEKSFVHQTWHLYTRTDAALSGSPDEETSWSAELYDASAYSPADLSYLSGESGWLGEQAQLMADDAASLTPLQTGTYRNAQPVLGSADGAPVMVWTKADTARGTYNAPYLVYSVYKDGAWSAPAKVDGDGTADSGASLCTGSDGSLWLVYQNESQTFADDSSCTADDYAAASVVTAAKYDAATGGFTDFTPLSTTGSYGHTASIAVVDGVPTAAWVENTDSDYFGINLTNQLCSAQYQSGAWSAPTVLASNLSAVTEAKVGSVNGKVCVAAITDGDNDLSTTGDRMITACPLGGTPNALAAGSVSAAAFAALPGSSGETLLWSGDGVLKSYDGTSTSDILTNGMLTDSFTVLPDRIVFNGADTVGGAACSNIFALLHHEDGTWSDPIRLTDQDKYLQSYAAETIGGKTYLAAVQTGVTISETDVTDDCTLSWGQLGGVTDVGVEAAEPDQSKAAPNASVPVSVDLVNSGDTTLNDVTLKILDGSGNAVATQALTGLALAPSARTTQTINLTLGDTVTLTNYKVTAEAANDSNTENNSAAFSVGYSNLTVSAEFLQLGSARQILAKVTNSGASAAGGKLNLFANGSQMGSVKIDTLAAGESQILQINVTKDLLNDQYSSVVTLSAEPDVETLSEFDNTAQVYVELPYVDGVAIDSLTAASVSLTVKNSVPANIYLAIYDANGKLLKVTATGVAEKAGSITVDSGLSSLPSGGTIRAIVLKQSDFTPLCTAAVKTIP